MTVQFRYIFAAAVAFSSAFSASAQSNDFLSEGYDAFLNYDFATASALYEKYAKALAKKPDEEGERTLEKLQRQLEIAESSLDNVQKIEIIQRIDVPVEEFVAAIALPADGPRLLGKDQVPLKERYNNSDYVFATPYGDVRLWTEADADGVSHLYESTRLTDGSWELPVAAGDVLNDGGNIKNPFMLADGTTVYFASDGDGSMGGFDLFVASKDPVTGEYLQPTGVGYPFNSPFNEYMMAIDDENGIGWWVTDRNRVPGKVSVYVFKTNEVRKNYIADEEEDIEALAKVEDIALAQNPEVDYSRIAEEIGERAENAADDEDSGINFRLPGGRVIRQVADLRSTAAKRSMAQYLNAEAEFDSNLGKLRMLRMKYHKAKGGKGASMALVNQIKDLEKTTDAQREKLKTMRNSIISAELKNTKK